MSTMKDFMDEAMKQNEPPDEMNLVFLKQDLCPYCGFTDYASLKMSFYYEEDVKTLHNMKCFNCQAEWEIVYNSEGEIEHVGGDKNGLSPKVD